MSATVAIKLNKEFQRAYKRGKSSGSSLLVTYAVKNKLLYSRIGITTSKKLGNAVERNRCKRVIRASFSSLKECCEPGYDFVFVARHKTKSAKMQLVARDMRRQLASLGAIKENMGES